MQEIWRTQQLHLECIQDPPGVQLYRNTGQVTKDGVILPSYRYARGSTSLESFHLHLNRQWNEARGVAAVEGASREEICYGGQLLQYCNALSQQLLALKLAQDYTSPGELIGVEYLYSQTSRAFEEDVGVDPDIPDGIRGDKTSRGIWRTVSVAESSSPALSTQSQMESVGPDGQAGYDHVIRLANSLCKVDEIVMLWNNLSCHDKGRLIYPPCQLKPCAAWFSAEFTLPVRPSPDSG
ncbi:unnamed protein product [Leuciscus chuanchicus]